MAPPVVRTAARAVTFALAASLASGVARGEDLALSNTPVTASHVDALFPVRSGPGVIDGGGDIGLDFIATYLVYEGRVGTVAEGLLLYEYRVQPVDTSIATTTLRSLSVPAEELVAIDLDGDLDADSSGYCTDCPSAPGTPPDRAARTDHEVRWEFDAGFQDLTAPLYVVSPARPARVFSRLATVTEEADLQLVPEPGSGALATSLATLAALGWKQGVSRRRRGSGPSAA